MQCLLRGSSAWARDLWTEHNLLRCPCASFQCERVHVPVEAQGEG